MLPELQKLLALGAYLFPCVPNGREPIGKWRRDSTNLPFVVEAMAAANPFCNWGVDCGKSGWVVLDVDVKNGKPGQASLEQLMAECPEFTIGLTVRTATGGTHIYFQGLAGNRVNFRPGLDFRGVGGYVVCPGSFIDGQPYVFYGNETIPDLPEWLGNLAGKPKERTLDADIPMTEPDRAEQVHAAVEYLELFAPLAVEGQGGDETTFRVACRVRDLGLSEDRAREIMSLHWNPRCEPPWTEEDLALKVENAYRYAKDRQGNDTPEGRNLEAVKHFSNLEPPAEELIYHLISEIGNSRPERKWIANGWIPAGSAKPSLFTGDGATGKSLLALQLGMSVAAGLPWLGMSVEQMPVLFVTCEDDREELDIRVWDIRHASPEGYGKMPKDTPFYVVPRVGFENVICIEQDGRTFKGPFWAALNRFLGKFRGPKLLILDTVADMYAGNESNRSGVTTFLKSILGELVRINDCTPLLIAHPPKAQGQTYSGSTAWHNSVRNRVFLAHQNPKARGAYRVMTNEKANAAAGDAKMVLQWKEGLFLPVDQAELQSVQDSAVMTVIDAAARANEPLSLSYQSPRFIGRIEIANCEGKAMPKSDIMDVVNRLIGEGGVKNVTGQKHGNGLFIS